MKTELDALIPKNFSCLPRKKFCLPEVSGETKQLIKDILKGQPSKKNYKDLIVIDFAWYIAEHYVANKSLEGMRAVLQELRLIAPILFVAGFLTRSALKRITAAAPNDNDVPWLLSALMAGILAAGQSIALTAGAECSNWFLRSYLGFQIPRILAGSVGAGFGSAAGESFLGFLRISAENNLIIKPSKISRISKLMRGSARCFLRWRRHLVSLRFFRRGKNRIRSTRNALTCNDSALQGNIRATSFLRDKIHGNKPSNSWLSIYYK
jgi:hypothetical protein